jgi:hypothetical protein
MGRGRFVLCQPDGKRTDYPLLEATLSTGRSGGVDWLMAQASARPADWSPDTGEPEPPTVEVLVRVAGPEPAAWIGREFVVPEGRDEQTGCYPAWLYYDEGYEVLGRCLVSLGDEVRDEVGARVVGWGTLSGCAVEVTGVFRLTAGGDKSRV